MKNNNILNDTDKAEVFNDYFTSISKVDNVDGKTLDNLNECLARLDHIYIFRQDVLDIIKSLRL